MTSDQNKYEELKLYMSLALGKIQNNNKTFNKKMLANDIRKYWMFKSYFFNYCEQLNYFTIIDIDYDSDDPVYDTIDQIDYYTGGPLGMVRLDDMCISYYTYKQIFGNSNIDTTGYLQTEDELRNLYYKLSHLN